MMMCSAVTSLGRPCVVIFDLVRADELADAHLVLHVVLPEQVADAVLELVGDLAGAADDLGEIDLEVVEGDAGSAASVRMLADECAVFEQGLGGDAAPVEAGAAEVFLFDAEDAFLELPRADGGGVTGGAAADDDDVVLVVSGFGGVGLGRRLRAQAGDLRRVGRADVALERAPAAAGVARWWLRRGGAGSVFLFDFRGIFLACRDDGDQLRQPGPSAPP